MPRKIKEVKKVSKLLPSNFDVSQIKDLSDPDQRQALAVTLNVLHLIPKDSGRPYVMCDEDMGGMTQSKDGDKIPQVDDDMFYTKDREVTSLVAKIDSSHGGFKAYFEGIWSEVKDKFTELTAILQLKDLSAKNFDSFLKMIGLTPLLKSYWNELARILTHSPAKLAADAEVSTFAAYHLTLTSTPELCKKFLDDAPALANVTLTAADIQAIKGADPEVFDHKIPAIAVATTYCFLKAAGYDFGKWYQGEKAVNSMSVHFRNGRIALFSTYLKLSSDVGNTEAYTRTTDVLAVLSGSKSGKQVEEEAEAREEAQRIDAAIKKAIVKASAAAAASDAMAEKMSETVAARAVAINELLSRV